MLEYQGKRNAQDLNIGIVVSKFNKMITEHLLQGAVEALRVHGADKDKIDVCWVPGCFEIPHIAKQLAKKQTYDAIICLGAVIRGQTPHFDYVAAQAASGIAQVGLEFDIPTIFGVLTTDTTEQALERAGIKGGNKGYDAALAAIEMASLIRQIAPAPLQYTSKLNSTSHITS